MRKTFACIKKDIKLFFSNKAGILIFILPALLITALYFGSGDVLETDTLVKPFAIAVRDNEDSVNTRLLISEMTDVDIFETVYILKDGGTYSLDTTDEEMFALGCAAVVDVPEGFFSEIYYMSDGYSTVTLNPDMPSEGRIVKSIFGNFIKIVESEEAAWISEYKTRCENLTDEEYKAMWEEASNHELEKIFSREDVFSYQHVSKSQTEGKIKYIYISVMSMMCMFIPLSVLKSLPEEKRLNISKRFLSANKTSISMHLSKFLFALLLYVVIGVSLTVVIKPEIDAVSILVLLAGFAVSFALFTLLGSLVKDVSRMQTYGNLIIIFSMIFGGCFYPIHLFPEWAQIISRGAIPFYMFEGLL